MPELEDRVYETIKRLCSDADGLAEAGDLSAALREYLRALELVPEPRSEWTASTWILTSVGDCLFAKHAFIDARKYLLQAMECPEAVGNPFIHLRLGQCEYELGTMDRAADELSRAFLLEGEGLFESEDAKYLAFVKSRLLPPDEGWK